jgi:predicted exporter
VRHLTAFSGPSAEDVLLTSEALDRELRRLTEAGAIGGAEIASRFLPSRATQLARRAALPDPETLRARLEAAAAGLPFRLDAFRPFLDDVAASRALEPLTLESLPSPILAARLEPLLFRRAGTWYGVAALVDVRDGAAVAAALNGPIGARATYIDVKAETDALIASYTGESLRWISLGVIAVLLSLVLGLRSAEGVLRVAFPIAGALLVTLVVLELLNLKLTLFHLVSLLLMIGVSLDYSLFVNRAGMTDQDSGYSVRSIVICNACTLLTFGLLVFCDTPVLRSIGVTVAVGTFSAILLSLVFAPRRARLPV